MSLLRAVGSFQAGTGTTQIDVVTTDPTTAATFQPKLVLFMCSASDVSGVNAGGKFSFGAASSTTQRFALTYNNTDGANPTTSDCGIRNDACLGSVSSAGASDGRLDLVSFNADGFSVVPDDAFPYDAVVAYIAFGGTDIVNAKVGNFTAAASTGNQAITDPGFNPDALILFGTPGTTANAVGPAASMCIGWASSSSDQGTISARAQDATATTVASSLCSTARCLSIRNSGGDTINSDWSFVQFDATGFTLNRLTGTPQVIVGYIAIEGPNVKALSFAARTDTNTSTITGAGFTPGAALFAAAHRTASNNAFENANAVFSLGWSDGTNHRAASFVDGDAITGADIASRSQSGVALQQLQRDSANTFSVRASGDVDSFNSDGFVWDQITADSQATLILALVLGGAGADRCTVETQPAGAVDNAAFTTQPTVQLRDPGGNAVAQAGVTVTASIFSGSGALIGDTTKDTDAAGLATFTDLGIDGYGDHVVRFTPTSLTPDDSDTVFVFGAGAAAKVAWEVHPTNAPEDTALSPTVRVQLLNAGDEKVPTSGTTIAVAITAAGGLGTLNGDASNPSVAGGYADFPGLNITLTSGADIFQLTASSGILTTDDSDEFVIYPVGSGGSRNLFGPGGLLS